MLDRFSSVRYNIHNIKLNEIKGNESQFGKNNKKGVIMSLRVYLVVLGLVGYLSIPVISIRAKLSKQDVTFLYAAITVFMFMIYFLMYKLKY